MAPPAPVKYAYPAALLSERLAGSSGRRSGLTTLSGLGCWLAVKSA
ncbi:hypothetical protein KCP69_23795 [Salmonella enterica subsp. enterica]|nr:hypothetical protein KCP69_23795 [Salmonella enterica subsp. enterica]